MSQPTSAFYSGISTSGHMISVESYNQFHSEIFSAKPKEFIGRQTDHRWWDLGSPGGSMGRIWRPGDHISAALPQYLCSPVPMFPKHVPQSLCSPNQFTSPYVPPFLFHRSLFHSHMFPKHVPQSLCSPVSIGLYRLGNISRADLEGGAPGARPPLKIFQIRFFITI